jgi:hypothetical protein
MVAEKGMTPPTSLGKLTYSVSMIHIFGLVPGLVGWAVSVAAESICGGKEGVRRSRDSGGLSSAESNACVKASNT